LALFWPMEVSNFYIKKEVQHSMIHVYSLLDSVS
jgi:hypothetical protein